jgi:hypothetical protein
VKKKNPVYTVKGRRFLSADRAIDVAEGYARRTGKPIAVGQIGYGLLHTVLPSGEVGPAHLMAKQGSRLPNPRKVKLPTKFTMMPVRVNSKGEVQIKVSPGRTGGRVPKNVKSVERNNPGKQKRRIRAARKAERRKAGFPERNGRERGPLSLRTRRALESGKRRGRKQKAPGNR